MIPPPALQPAPSPAPRRDPWMAALPLIALAMLTALLCWMYAPVFRGEPCGDDNTHHLTEVALIADSVAHGDWDWWNPAGNAGFPTGYYYQLLPAALPGLAAAAFGDPLFWFQIAIFLSLVLVPAATYRGLRVMGADPWPAFGGAFVAPFLLSGIKWGGGAEGIFWVGLYTQGVALLGYPLALGHGWRWISEGKSGGAAVFWGLFVGLSHPMAGVTLGGALLVATPVALIARYDEGFPATRLMVLGALMLVGSASCWLQILIDYEAFGGFPHRLPDEAGPGFKLLAEWLLYGTLWDENRFQPVVSWLLMPTFVITAVLTALGRPRYLAMLWTNVVLFLFILGVGRHLRTGDDDLFPAVRVLGALQATVAMVIGATLVAGAAEAIRLLGRVRNGWLGQGAIGWVLGITAAAIAGNAAWLHHERVRIPADYDRIHRDELTPIMAAMRTATPGRVQQWGRTNEKFVGVENHWFISLPFVYEWRGSLSTFGGAALQSSPNFFYLHATPEPTRSAWIYDAPLVLTNHDRGSRIGGELLVSTEHFELRELPSPGLVSAVQVMGELPAGRARARKVVLEWQRSDQPMNNQVLAHAGYGIAGPPPDGDVLGYARGPSTITARVHVRKPTTFLFRESWHPRWTATIDGKPARIRRVTPDMIALDVGPGDHALALSFERPWWQWSLWLLFPLAALVGWLAERWVGHRRRPWFIAELPRATLRATSRA
jgi:hypothetical protein